MSDTDNSDKFTADQQLRDVFLELPSSRGILTKLDEVYASSTGICLLTGPSSSGRRRLLYGFGERIKPDAAVAILDGQHDDEIAMLNSIFAQFGYDYSSTEANELLGMLRVFAVHQANAGCRPFIGILNGECLNQRAAHMVDKLAELKNGREPALSLVMSGTPAAIERITATDLSGLAGRCTRALELHPLTDDDFALYMKEKFDIVIDDAELQKKFLDVSGGLSGVVDLLMHNLLSMKRGYSAAGLAAILERPIGEYANSGEFAAPRPHLLISQSGQLLGREEVTGNRLMIGRAVHNDILLDSRYISRHHALIVSGPENSDWLIDLNSRNGTFVNSRAIDYIALRDNDIIAMGNHRLKYVNVALSAERPPKSAFANSATSLMKTLPEAAVKLVPFNRESQETG